MPGEDEEKQAQEKMLEEHGEEMLKILKQFEPKLKQQNQDNKEGKDND